LNVIKPGNNLRKLIFAVNVTIDGFADHTAVIADDELHDFYTNLLSTVDIVLFGRKTYQLLESYWPKAPEDPNATKSMTEFANKINSLPKIVFSKTLDKAGWNNTRLIKGNIIDEVLKLKEQSGKSLSIGGLSIASTFMKHGLIDEYWFLVQPIILGRGKRLFEGITDRISLKLVDEKTFNSGVVVFHYKKNIGS
jgi:dihydrofolate reductase